MPVMGITYIETLGAVYRLLNLYKSYPKEYQTKEKDLIIDIVN